MLEGYNVTSPCHTSTTIIDDNFIHVIQFGAFWADQLFQSIFNIFLGKIKSSLQICCKNVT